MSDPSPTLAHRLAALARARPDQIAYRFLETGEVEGPIDVVTYAELHRRVRALAARLLREGLRGERALLLYPAGIDYVTAFLACVQAGVVSVPAYPPDPGRVDRTLPRLRALIRDCGARVVLTLAPLAGVAAVLDHAPELGRLGWITTDDLRGADDDDDVPWPRADDLAFLQYTSGSTGDPRGVMVRNRNLIANGAMIQRSFGLGEGDVNVSWLPPYHDMGLIGGILQTLQAGMSGVLMSPTAFLQRPARWLRAITAFAGVKTISSSPNFGYALCARRIGEDERRGLDLSRWTIAFNGAEPVRADTLRRFVAAFAPSGFREGSFFPGYGLAEATLFVSGGPVQAPPTSVTLDPAALARGAVRPTDEGSTLVSCGTWTADTEVRIVDPERRTPCDADAIGEIWVAGPHVTAGYWGRPEASAATFGGTLAGSGEGPYLRTGDLGFVRGGQLYFAGRARDVIVIRGRKLWPQDLEATVEASHPAVREGGVAAFAVDGGLGLLVELRESTPASTPSIAAAIRGAVVGAHGVSIADLALTRPGQLLKTSSGKVMRGACREAVASGATSILWREVDDAVDGAIDNAAAAPPIGPSPAGDATSSCGHGPLRARIVAEAERLLERRLVDGDRTVLVAAGLDSLLAVELSQRLGDALGRAIPAAIWFEHATLGELADRLEGGELGARPTFDLLADARLADDLVVDVARPIAGVDGPTCVLLTGVTGVLGAFLLDALLRRTSARVICLIRAADEASAMARIRATLGEYGLDLAPGSPALERVQALAGDLASPGLGLDEATRDALARDVDRILHNGALVHFAYSYEACRPANVLGTLEVLRLATRGPRRIPVHHVSTTAVFSHAHAGRTVTPADATTDPERLDMGYSRSKWVAERLVMEAGARGLPVTILRPGLVTGASEGGACHLTNFVWNVLRASIEVGSLPDFDRVLDMVPVDWAARTIVRNLERPAGERPILHLVNHAPTSIHKVHAWLSGRGYSIRRVSFERWQIQLMQRIGATPSMQAVLPVLSLAAADFYARRQVRHDAPEAAEPFDAAGDPCPPADEALLETYRRYFVGRGFLPEVGRPIRRDAGPERLLRGQRLHEMIVEVTGVDLDGAGWREPLDVLLADMARRRYRPGGLERAITRLLLGLLRRARIVDARRRSPEIGAVPIAPPIFIAAPPRSGTTLLHNLLARDPEHRAFALWELMGPVTPRGAGEGWEGHMIAVARELVAETYERSPTLRSIHPLDAEAPDECQWLFAATGQSLIHAIAAHAPNYAAWMLAADMHDAYRFHRDALQCLLWRRPGAQVVCKDPWHLWHLDALLAVYPGARVILVHRDMREVVPSLCSLTRALRSVEAEPDPDEAVGPFAVDLLARGLERAEQARAAAPEAFVDLDYVDLVADPIGTIRGLYHRLGRELSAPAEAAMRAWLAATPADKHGPHRYTLERFGLAAREVAARFAAHAATSHDRP
ncbi:MAG: thioester reductase domain-containing protein [Nannocystaceae bacterium]